MRVPELAISIASFFNIDKYYYACYNCIRSSFAYHNGGWQNKAINDRMKARIMARLDTPKISATNPLAELMRGNPYFYLGLEEHRLLGILGQESGPEEIWLVRSTLPGSKAKRMTQAEILQAIETREKSLALVAGTHARKSVPKRVFQAK